jgi:hypothetical protein
VTGNVVDLILSMKVKVVQLYAMEALGEEEEEEV